MLDFLLMKVWGPTAPHSPLLYKRASPHRALVLILSEHEPCGTGYLYSSVVCTHTMIIVLADACPMIILHACPMFIVNASCPTELVFAKFRAGSAGRSPPGQARNLGCRQGPQCLASSQRIPKMTRRDLIYKSANLVFLSLLRHCTEATIHKRSMT